MADDDGGFDRVSTGIDGLDELLNGGVPQGNLTLLSGPPGTGKSTFGLQFLMAGVEAGEPGVYVSLGEDPDRIIKNMRAFGWDVDGPLEEDVLRVVSPELYKYDQLMDDLRRNAEDMEAERVVLDSITVLKSYFEDDFTIRRRIMEFKQLLEELGATTMTMAESTHAGANAVIEVEEYVADGVIDLYYREDGDSFTRYLAVRKMRGTEHGMEIHPISIGEGGISME